MSNHLISSDFQPGCMDIRGERLLSSLESGFPSAQLQLTGKRMRGQPGDSGTQTLVAVCGHVVCFVSDKGKSMIFLCLHPVFKHAKGSLHVPPCPHSTDKSRQFSLECVHF